ncbi:MAG: hypothetical protein HC945_02755, partial [Nitrosarchaeum sp.]|nr:hypothetical protein [Nitrosarchaeum sp.]
MAKVVVPEKLWMRFEQYAKARSLPPREALERALQKSMKSRTGVRARNA